MSETHPKIRLLCDHHESVMRVAIFVVGIVVGGCLVFVLSRSEADSRAGLAPSRSAELAMQNLSPILIADAQDAVKADNGDAGNTAAIDRNIYDRVAKKFGKAMLEPSPQKRSLAFFNALQTLKTEEVQPLMRLFYRLNRHGLSFPDEWNALWVRWGEIDGPAAVDAVLKNPGSVWEENGMRRAFTGWTSSNPQAAFDWLSSHEDSPLYDTAFIGYATGYSERDFNTAAKVVEKSVPASHPLASKAMEILAEAAVRQGQLRGMTDWFESLPDEGDQQSLKHSAFMHVWWRIYHADPQSAQKFLEQHAAQPFRDDRQYDVMMQKLTEQNPKTALDWAASLPPSPTTKTWPGVTNAVRVWMAKDAPSVTQWLDSQQPNAFTDYSGAIIRSRIRPNGK